MKLRIIVCGLFIPLFSVSVFSEKLLLIKMGPLWPRELLHSEKPTSWDASILVGGLIDRKVSIGAGFDFLWNQNKKEEQIQGNTYRLDMVEKTLMFPISGYLLLTPFSNRTVHPVISGQIGLNTMYFSHTEDSTFDNNRDGTMNENGWYMGLYGKAAADAALKIGEKSTLFVGMDYQWSRPKKLGENNSKFFQRRTMSGFGLRFGLGTIY